MRIEFRDAAVATTAVAAAAAADDFGLCCDLRRLRFNSLIESWIIKTIVGVFFFFLTVRNSKLAFADRRGNFGRIYDRFVI